jgi:beta-lactamase class A
MIHTTKLDTLAEHIHNLVSRYTGAYQFCFEDFRTQQKLLIGTPRRYPFASSFKMAVLGAYLEKFSDPVELDRVVTIEETDLCMGSGILNTMACPQYISIRNLLTIAMAYSDNTATDWLIKQVSMEAVQAYIDRFTADSKLTYDLSGLLAIQLREYRKKRQHRPHEPFQRLLKESVEEQALVDDYTNAADLMRLLQGFFDVDDTQLTLRKNLLAKGRGAYVWTERYFPDSVRFYGKTGTLGLGLAINDCGILEKDGQFLGAFAFCGYEWNIPRHVAGHIFALVGVELLNYYDINPSDFFWDCKIIPNPTFYEPETLR